MRVLEKVSFLELNRFEVCTRSKRSSLESHYGKKSTASTHSHSVVNGTSYLNIYFIRSSSVQTKRNGFESSCPILATLRALVATLGLLFAAPGPLSGRSWPLLSRSWAALGRSWQLLGCSCAALGLLLGLLGLLSGWRWEHGKRSRGRIRSIHGPGARNAYKRRHTLTFSTQREGAGRGGGTPIDSTNLVFHLKSPNPFFESTLSPKCSQNAPKDV